MYLSTLPPSSSSSIDRHTSGWLGKSDEEEKIKSLGQKNIGLKEEITSMKIAMDIERKNNLQFEVENQRLRDIIHENQNLHRIKHNKLHGRNTEQLREIQILQAENKASHARYQRMANQYRIDDPVIQRIEKQRRAEIAAGVPQPSKSESHYTSTATTNETQQQEQIIALHRIINEKVQEINNLQQQLTNANQGSPPPPINATQPSDVDDQHREHLDTARSQPAENSGDESQSQMSHAHAPSFVQTNASYPVHPSTPIPPQTTSSEQSTQSSADNGTYVEEVSDDGQVWTN
jgi:hypothetical protein